VPMRKAPEIFNQAGVTMARLAKKVKQLLEAKLVRHDIRGKPRTP
jgi:hypothetical protein